MRLARSLVLVAWLPETAAFATTGATRWGKRLFSAVEASAAEGAAAAAPVDIAVPASQQQRERAPLRVLGLTADEINARRDAQMAKLREKDSRSTKLSKDDLKVVYEDDHIVVIDKPAGVLTVSARNEFPNLAQAVCENVENEWSSADRMVVHRLGMDTSGLIVFAKTLEAVRGMNEIFRNRAIERKYEALVCGHIEKGHGLIDLPIMRDYEFPPFVRISSDEQQAALNDLEVEHVGKKILERPKHSLTRYEVISREQMNGQPVSRVTLSSISGRYHQLNVHMAAFGHPIVGDATYGINGDAARNGGLTEAEQDLLIPNSSRASAETQQAIAQEAKSQCVHAKSLKFRHPVTQEEVSLISNAPF